MNPERTAERPTELCAAYSCPLLGTMTMSTKGGNDWYCFCHFGKEADQRDAITTVIRQNPWTVDAILNMRRLSGKELRAAREQIDHDLGMSKNGALQREFREKGLLALEGFLLALVTDALHPKDGQKTMPLGEAA